MNVARRNGPVHVVPVYRHDASTTTILDNVLELMMSLLSSTAASSTAMNGAAASSTADDLRPVVEMSSTVLGMLLRFTSSSVQESSPLHRRLLNALFLQTPTKTFAQLTQQTSQGSAVLRNNIVRRIVYELRATATADMNWYFHPGANPPTQRRQGTAVLKPDAHLAEVAAGCSYRYPPSRRVVNATPNVVPSSWSAMMLLLEGLPVWRDLCLSEIQSLNEGKELGDLKVDMELIFEAIEAATECPLLLSKLGLTEGRQFLEFLESIFSAATAVTHCTVSAMKLIGYALRSVPVLLY
eukprot:Lankesteria_metandrocarpae@DN10327_c0_g1_i1.p1